MYTYTYICIHDTNPNDTQICNFTKRYKYNQKLFKRPTCMKIDLYKNLTSTKKRPTPNKKMAKRLQVQNTYSYTIRTYTEKHIYGQETTSTKYILIHKTYIHGKTYIWPRDYKYKIHIHTQNVHTRKNVYMAKRLQVQNTYSYTKRTYTEKDLCTTRQWSRKLHVCV